MRRQMRLLNRMFHSYRRKAAPANQPAPHPPSLGDGRLLRSYAGCEMDPRQHARRLAIWRFQAGVCWALVLGCWGAGFARAVVITVSDSGAGCEYMSGVPITLPAASVSTNRFGIGAQVISNRLHVVRPAMFDTNGHLARVMGEPAAPSPDPTLSESRFPSYLEGQPYVWFLQNLRHYTNYACTVTVDQPVTCYLLVDNRVNDYLPASTYDDPVFGAPDTQWMLDDGWERVNTGLTPTLTPTNRGDYVAIDEGNNGTINQVYAVYAKRLDSSRSVTLRTELDGNVYCLVVSTNPPVDPPLPRRPAGTSATKN